MDKKITSVLNEIFDYAPSKDKELFIESRGLQVIASAQHLIRLIRESFDEETAHDLSKRLARAIISEDQEKFTRKLKQLREANQKGKSK